MQAEGHEVDMPPIELGGLLAAAALAGALAGALLAARSARLAQRAAHEEEFIESLVGWLAARRIWREAGVRMIRRVRRLAQEPRSSERFEAYCRSARKAQMRFRKATRQLTSAEAAMETWRGDSLALLAAPPSQPTYLQVRRAAMRGGAERIELLVRRLRLADDADLSWVRAERVRMRARRSVIAHASLWFQKVVYGVVRSWERPR